MYGSVPATKEQQSRNLTLFIVILGGISALYLFPELWKDLKGEK